MPYTVKADLLKTENTMDNAFNCAKQGKITELCLAKALKSFFRHKS